MKRFIAQKSYLAMMLIMSVFVFMPGVSEATWDSPDFTTVSSTVPSNAATGVAIGKKITVTFSEAMVPASVNTKTITVKQGSTSVQGSVTYSGVTAVFTPANNLASSTVYTGTVTTGANNVDGEPLARDYIWHFTTGSAADTTAPRVTGTAPVNAATSVPVGNKLTATFSEPMAPATISTASFTLKQGTTAVSGAVTYAGVTAVFTPASNLLTGTLYTATITTLAKDLAGNALASSYTWSFTTGPATTTVGPTVTILSPANYAAGVCPNKTIAATFSEAMNPLTISTSTFTLKNGVTLVPGTVTYSGVTAIFTPAANLGSFITYTATITTGAKNLAGSSLAFDQVQTFTTGSTACMTPIVLGAAAPFGAFGGGAGITNQGIFTVVNGDIGTTAVSTLITGFHDKGANVYTQTPLNNGTVNGTIYTATAPPGSAPGVIAAAAALAAKAAYISLSPAALPGGIDVSTLGGGAGALGGRTLAPGIYKSAPGSYSIRGGNLTLDARGDANAVWVFQMASSLTVGGPGAAFPQSVILVNGAQAKNVFWQVGSSATINAAGGGTMVGTIISYATTTFSTAGNVTIVTLEGRALALNASVTLVNTHINVPAP